MSPDALCDTCGHRFAEHAEGECLHAFSLPPGVRDNDPDLTPTRCCCPGFADSLLERVVP